MHDGVIWFDTAACTQPIIGMANELAIGPKPIGGWVTGWWADLDNNPTAPIYDAKNQATGTRENAWDTDIMVTSGTLPINDENLYKDFLKDFVAFLDDCDIDC